MTLVITAPGSKRPLPPTKEVQASGLHGSRQRANELGVTGKRAWGFPATQLGLTTEPSKPPWSTLGAPKHEAREYRATSLGAPLSEIGYPSGAGRALDPRAPGVPLFHAAYPYGDPRSVCWGLPIRLLGASDPLARGLGSARWGPWIRLLGASDPLAGGLGSVCWGSVARYAGVRGDFDRDQRLGSGDPGCLREMWGSWLQHRSQHCAKGGWAAYLGRLTLQRLADLPGLKESADPLAHHGGTVGPLSNAESPVVR